MTLALRPTWQRTRAILLHDHFRGIATRLEHANGAGLKLTGPDGELARMSFLLQGKLLNRPGEPEKTLDASIGTLRREWSRWNRGGRKSDALLLNYKPGVGGHKAMPEPLVMELQRRCTLPTGGRDKHGRSPVSVAWDSLCRDFLARKPLPGVDYDQYPVGAEIPWSYRTAVRKKPAKTLRALGNIGGAAHKAMGAYVSMDYSKLRKGELYTLDDVRLDILCIDHATRKVIQVNLYVLMEVASRCIVSFVMRPAAAIHAEDVDELLATGLQTPGFGIGVDYVTHILFERGTTACSEGAQLVLEGVTEGRIKVHRTSMNGGVRWIGSPADKKSGNAAGKGCIESFHRWLHFALLHLPGQRGNSWDNAPANLGYESESSRTPHSLAAETEKLAQFSLAADQAGIGTDGRPRLVLKLDMLYMRQLHDAVRDAINRHNTESGHAYRGHGSHWENEIAPGVWRREDAAPLSLTPSLSPELHAADTSAPAPARNIHFDDTLLADTSLPPRQSAPSPATTQSPKSYKLNQPAVELSIGQKNALYWNAWNKLKRAAAAADQPVQDEFRFALTRRSLGAVVKIKAMTPDQFRKVLSCFDQVAAKYAAPSGNTPF